MTTNAYQGPLPVKQPESDFYWEKAQAHELWLRRCVDCGKAFFYPRDFCPGCGDRNVEWTQASGRGTLHTFAIVHRAPLPAFRDNVPFVVAMVDLEEGPRIPTNLVGVDPRPGQHQGRHGRAGRLRGRNGGSNPAGVPSGVGDSFADELPHPIPYSVSRSSSHISSRAASAEA